MAKQKKYEVVVADDMFFFSFEDMKTETQVQRIFKRRVDKFQSELFPGLRLRDNDGQLLKPKLQIILVPAKEAR